MSKTRPGRAPPLPRGRWCAPGRRLSSARHPPLFHGQSLRPRWNIPPAGLTFTRRQQGFTHVRPSPPGSWPLPQGREAHHFPPVFSSPAAPGWDRGRFGFFPGLRTPQLPAAHARAETGQRALARILRLRHQPHLHQRLPLELMHPHAARNPLCVPKTYATWADVLHLAVGSVPRLVPGQAGGANLAEGAMILGLWA